MSHYKRRDDSFDRFARQLVNQGHKLAFAMARSTGLSWAAVQEGESWEMGAKGYLSRQLARELRASGVDSLEVLNMATAI
jgi:hypothetical protein